MESLKDKLIKMQKGAYLAKVKSDLEELCKTEEEFELLNKIQFWFVEFSSRGNDEFFNTAISGGDISPFISNNPGTPIRFHKERTRLFNKEEVKDSDRKEAGSDKGVVLGNSDDESSSDIDDDI